MMNKKSSTGWLKYFNISQKDILDPDGWNRRDFGVSWTERIDLAEFQRRLRVSTVKHTKGIGAALDAFINTISCDHCGQEMSYLLSEGPPANCSRCGRFPDDSGGR